ncbi:hypothetical protein SO802_013398 [Lithocarpus litseifolius]|uniref:MULE transposase domain-containing protein n=1 Tax=Lithocarpus litseifolius TaxID=425828 RepID=A0AAW2D7P6_9ROSI
MVMIINNIYNRIWDYCETLKATNVGTTTLMLVDRSTLDVADTFQRLYICLQATKEGFKAGCRPLIGLDGCFLKGNQKGQILSAVGRDANDNMYPIAMAIVETESKDNYVHLYYTIETYMKAYEPIIYLVASMEQWRRTSIDPLEPPKDKIQRGRPKIKRKRHPSEPKNPYKLSKASTIIKCSECKKAGHNSRACPSKKDKGIVSTNAKKTPTTNKKQAAGGARATAASDVDSRAGGSRTVASSAVDSRARGSRVVAASSTGVRTSTAPLTIYGGAANSERVLVPTLEKAIQRMQAKKKKRPWV